MFHIKTLIGLNVEPAATNLCPYSQDLSNWSKSDAGDTLNTNTQYATPFNYLIINNANYIIIKIEL